MMQNNPQFTVIVFQELPSLVHSRDFTVFISDHHVAHARSRIARNEDRCILHGYFFPAI